MCMPLTELQFMAFKIENNVSHCATHAAHFSISMIYIFLQ